MPSRTIGLLLAALSPSAIAAAAPPAICPRAPAQADMIQNNIRDLRRLRPDHVVKRAISAVYSCRPSHPVLGGPARIRFVDAHVAPRRGFYLRFGVAGLSDIYLVYLADERGNLVRGFVGGP